MKEFYTPNDFLQGTDSARIQAAVDAAHTTGCNLVKIPRLNEVSGKQIWIIDKTILLPSDMTVILSNCHLRMADGVMCQMFTNSNDLTEIGNTVQGEQKNIRIIGEGNAVLDGGEETPLNEGTSRKNGLPSIRYNVTIGLHNVSGFVLDNFTIRDQRWWAIRCSYADNGRISNLHFELTEREEKYHRWRNQDGIDLRIGCHDVVIENITGETGDDVIALTALSRKGGSDYGDIVAGKSSYIHHVCIDKVFAFCNFCAIVRLLSQQGNKIHDISISNIFDTSRYNETARVQMALRIGEDGYHNAGEDRGKPGDICNVSVSNIHTRAASVIHLEMAVKNFSARDIFIDEDGGYAATIGAFHCPGGVLTLYNGQDLDTVNMYTQQNPDDFELPSYIENVCIENVYCTSKLAPCYEDRGLFRFNNNELKNVVIKNVTCEEDRPMLQFYHDNNKEEITFEP